MLVLARALTYATLFVSLVLVLVPARVLEWSGIHAPAALGAAQLAGLAVATAGGALALWCVLAFAVLGRGTPAPFDPPRRLVVRGPYRFVRNPMYLGAGVALSGAALYYQSLPLLAYVAVFETAAHLFVVGYEEPTLARAFGEEYAAYRARVRRWVPGRGAARIAAG
ncbi:MAG TPA: isoprenylcysteine carboxylmethyltransferase family protein [Anaeromyxobacteraceae bacterium]|nr:isoprenylcysteine carboxylmethyltransferase family protein [Anaeromyxobacteraceae bacterium]